MGEVGVSEEDGSKGGAAVRVTSYSMAVWGLDWGGAHAGHIPPQEGKWASLS